MLEINQLAPQIRRSMLRTRYKAFPANRLRHSTNTERFLPAYLVCNVEYSHLPNSARTELLHEDKTSRYIAVRYCIHFSDYTHSWLQTEMRSWSVTVVVCIQCLVWRYRLRLCWSAYRRGGLFSSARLKRRHLVEENGKDWRGHSISMATTWTALLLRCHGDESIVITNNIIIIFL